VTGPGGSVTSTVAVVNVLPRLYSQTAGSSMTLTWPASFILQSSVNVTGPYTDVPWAVSPFLVRMKGTQRFFRLRSQPAALALQVAAGHPNIGVTGSLGANFVLQTSTNLANWVNLQTNTLPMSFVDTDVHQSPKRFYRAVMAH
jgi:hypothetical protein